MIKKHDFFKYISSKLSSQPTIFKFTSIFFIIFVYASSHSFAQSNIFENYNRAYDGALQQQEYQNRLILQQIQQQRMEQQRIEQQRALQQRKQSEIDSTRENEEVMFRVALLQLVNSYNLLVPKRIDNSFTILRYAYSHDIKTISEAISLNGSSDVLHREKKRLINSTHQAKCLFDEKKYIDAGIRYKIDFYANDEIIYTFNVDTKTCEAFFREHQIRK